MRAMNRRTDSLSWKILSTSIESSGRRIPIEMESLCTSMPRWINERCERLDTGRLLSAWGSFCLRVDDPRLTWQRSRPFHDDYLRPGKAKNPQHRRKDGPVAQSVRAGDS